MQFSKSFHVSQGGIPSGPTRKGGCAMLLGITATDFGWSADHFVSICGDSLNNIVAITPLLKVQYGPAGENASFKIVVSIMPVILGAKVGGKQQESFIDCDVRGPIRTCSSDAARIELLSARLLQWRWYRYFECSADHQGYGTISSQ